MSVGGCPLPVPPPLRGRGEEAGSQPAPGPLLPIAPRGPPSPSHGEGRGGAARKILLPIAPRGSPSPSRGEGRGGAARKILLPLALLVAACGVKGYPRPPRPDVEPPPPAATPAPAPAAAPAPSPVAAPSCTNCGAPDGGAGPESR